MRPRDDLAPLLKDLYAEADRLPRDLWFTIHFREFGELCSPEARGRSDWEVKLDFTKARLETAWESYRRLQISEKERTAETVAGHRLLVEGLAGWLEAVELCRREEFEAALEAAEEANRLLILVQVQAKRISSSLSKDLSQPRGF